MIFNGGVTTVSYTHLQKYIENGKQTTAFTKHGVTKDYHAASQILFDLGDGYFMISSKVVRQHTSPEKIKKQHNDVLYLAAPDGKTYDCSFLYDEKDGSYLPLGFEKDFFVKENGEADKQLTDKVVKDVQKNVGVDFISPEITQKYNDIVTQKKLRREMCIRDRSEDVDISQEVSRLQQKLEKQVKSSYSNLTPWQKSQVARHPQRPHCLDYVNALIEDFTPLCGDRLFADDEATVSYTHLPKWRYIFCAVCSTNCDTS